MGASGKTLRLGCAPARRRAGFVVAALLIAATATVARADDPAPNPGDPTTQVPSDPGKTCADQTAAANPGALGCDNKFTPIPKDGSALGWTQVAGAVFPGAPHPGYDPAQTNSKVPLTASLYSVSFLNPHNGLAGGAACKDDPPPGMSGQALTDFLDQCTRVPVIYRYTDNTQEGPIWHEAYRSDQPGYVGAVTWLRNQDTNLHGLRALAVGGDGRYVDREEAIPDDAAKACQQGAVKADAEGSPPSVRPRGDLVFPYLEADQGTIVTDPRKAIADCEDRWRQEHDPAGKGRAWLFSDEEWQPQDVPEGARGMQAVDASLRPDDCPGGTTECAFAGALQQIWMWKDGDFDALPWRADPDAGPSHSILNGGSKCGDATSCDWHFRVRAIRFVPSVDQTTKGAGAVTAGCCSAVTHPDPVRNGGRSLTFNPENGAWSVGQPAPSGQNVTIPDSLYALTFGKFSNRGAYDCLTRSYLFSPGGPPVRGEPGAQITNGDPCGGNGEFPPGGESLRYTAGAVRLVAGDGDSQGQQPNFLDREAGTPHRAQYPGGDNLMDWAVGSLKTTGQGAAFTTTLTSGIQGNVDAPYPIDCPGGSDLPGGATTGTNLSTKCQAEDSARLPNETKSGAYFTLSSYALRGFTMVGNSGVGWGVGDRGAIERLGGDSSASGGTLPPEVRPNVGARRQAALPDRSPYAVAEATPEGAPGAVPTLGFEQGDPSPEPVPTAYGSPNPHGGNPFTEEIGTIAMSRDGSEGWATGGPIESGRNKTALYHFTAGQWQRCGVDSVEGVIAADPACSALAPLAHRGGGLNSGVKLTTIARIPTEYDADPNNDDDFEAIAIGNNPPGDNASKPLIRYHDGRWRVDEEGTEQLANLGSQQTVTDLAFSAPDDGWVHGIGTGTPGLYHFDGHRWRSCTPGDGKTEDRGECRDAAGVLPLKGIATDIHLTNAGDRLYAYGTVAQSDTSIDSTTQGSGTHYPVIVYKDPGSCSEADDSGCWKAAFDPRRTDPNNPATQGDLTTLSVGKAADDTFTGLGVGFFTPAGVHASGQAIRARKSTMDTALVESDSTGTSWHLAPPTGAAGDYLVPHDLPKKTFPDSKVHAHAVVVPGAQGRGSVFVATGVENTPDPTGPVLWRNPADRRWTVLRTPFPTTGEGTAWDRQASVAALASDNRGGIWVVGDPALATQSWFYRYSMRSSYEVFRDVPHPIREEVTAAAGGADGSLWIATNTDVVYRYDRATGWDKLHIPGWDPGRVVTNPSPAFAIAIGGDGSGVVVGKNGRIADVGRRGGILDPAAGILCSREHPAGAPCGTGRTLRAAAVSDGGAAMVGGDDRALLYRNGAAAAFHAISPPPTATFSTITAISLPDPDRAWLTTNQGEIYRGVLDGPDWGWQREDEDRFGDSITRDAFRTPQILRDIAVDSSGHGYAVGDEGTLVERTGSGKPPWKRLESGHLDDLQTVTLGPDSHGALIGGSNGLILTKADGEFLPARNADHYRPSDYGAWDSGSHSMGIAALRGYRDGEIEAWNVTSVADYVSENRQPLAAAVLHYSSNPDDPKLRGESTAAGALSDTPSVPAHAISFAAFGNSNCQFDAGPGVCPELTGANQANDVAARSVRDSIVGGSRESTGPDFALFTGDVSDSAGTNEPFTTNTALDDSLTLNRWADLIGGPMAHAGIPVYGTGGERDTAKLQVCDPLVQRFCTPSSSSKSSLSWRQSMESMPAPWGAGEAHSSHGVTFEPVDTGGTRVEPGNQSVEDPTKDVQHTIADPTDAAPDQTIEDPTKAISSGAGLIGDKNPHHAIGDQTVTGPAGDQKIPTGGAHTHYALDIKRDGKALMRLVVLDTSLKSLAAADP
ncbi:MAG: hypothetical protein QOJ38_1130, partial [Solirubrobacterales bacterium]|nr:hypothetical protein [Solirubrobacterales bacterium]